MFEINPSEDIHTANDGVVPHLTEVLASDDVTASSGGNEDLSNRGSLLHGDNLVSRDGSLESVDGVDLSDHNASTHTVESGNTTLADITVSSDNGDLTSNHDIGGTLDSVNERFSASVEVVELGLGDGVVDVDGRAEETVVLVLEHAVEVVDTSGGLLGDTVAVLEHLGVFLVNKGGQVTTVIEDEVELLAILESVQLLLQAPFVLLLGLTLPGKASIVSVLLLVRLLSCYVHWNSGCGNGSSGVVLGGEDVARRPGDLSTKGSEGLDEDSSLDGHVETSCNACTLERLVVVVLLTGQHQTCNRVSWTFSK
jgi:hypothetical protein